MLSDISVIFTHKMGLLTHLTTLPYFYSLRGSGTVSVQVLLVSHPTFGGTRSEKATLFTLNPCSASLHFNGDLWQDQLRYDGVCRVSAHLSAGVV